MQIIGHRGAHRDKSEQNTPLAFCQAVVLGFTMMELDARLTKDGQLIVHHDPEAFHNGRRITIRDHLLEDLVTEGFCTEESVGFPRSKKSPTLESVLDVFLHQIDINVELKEKGAGRIFVDLLKNMSAKYDQFKSGEILKKLLVSSFEESELIEVKKFYPEIETALLLSNFQFPISSLDRKKLDRLRRFGVNAVHLPRRKATRDTVEYLKHQQGFIVRVYTVNYREIMFNCHNIGADGVFTDKIEMLSLIGSAKKSKEVSRPVFA